MKYLAIAVALAIAAPDAAHAEGQIWNALFVQGRTDASSGPAIWFDAHARRRDDSTLVLLRPAIGWAFSPALLVHAGYGFIRPVPGESAEHRVWQQVIYNHAATDAVKLQGRARLEQRFGNGDDVGHRVRLLARGQVQPWATPLQLVAWDEVFLGLNDTDWGAASGLDQNRLFLGVGADTAVRGVRVEVGYMNVYLHALERVDHVVAANVFVNLLP